MLSKDKPQDQYYLRPISYNLLFSHYRLNTKAFNIKITTDSKEKSIGLITPILIDIEPLFFF